jgi:hypothetical protein
MIRRNDIACRTLVALMLGTAATAALAAPQGVTLVPPNGARFLEHQRFDIRVEGQGASPYAAEIKINGRKVSFTGQTPSRRRGDERGLGRLTCAASRSRSGKYTEATFRTPTARRPQ